MPLDDFQRRPIIFVHGAWHGGWCWSDWTDIFRQENYKDTIAVELRGHGYKVGSFKHARLEDYVADVKRVIDNLSVDPILVGHSLGCTIIEHLCSERQFPAAILLAPVPHSRAFKKAFIRQIYKHPYISLKSGIRRNMQPWVASHISAGLFFSGLMPKQQACAYVERMQGESFRLFALDLLRDAPAVKKGTPILVMAAQSDAFFSPKMQAGTARDLGADFMIVDGSGHDIMLDVSRLNAARTAIGWLQSIQNEESTCSVVPTMLH